MNLVPCGTSFAKCIGMQTIQISIGEIIEAMYEGLIETYGDKELALVAAQALGDDLMERVANKKSATKRDR